MSTQSLFSSDVFGTDFEIKMSHAYSSRIIANEEDYEGRTIISFGTRNQYPFKVYIREADSDGNALDDSIIEEYNIVNIGTKINLKIKPQTTLLIIFEFNLARISILPESTSFQIEYYVTSDTVSNPITSDMYMFETAAGAPYQPHEIGIYSEHEFLQKTPLTAISSHMKQRAVSRIIIGHTHENERGYINRVYTLPKRDKTHGTLSVANHLESKKEQTYVYLDPLQNSKNVLSNGPNVIRGIMFQTTD